MINKIIKAHPRLLGSLKFYPAGAAAAARHLLLLPFRLTLLRHPRRRGRGEGCSAGGRFRILSDDQAQFLLAKIARLLTRVSAVLLRHIYCTIPCLEIGMHRYTLGIPGFVNYPIVIAITSRTCR